MKSKIFIAVDTTSVSKAKKIIKNTQTSKLKIGYKFGLEFLNSKNGRKFVSKLKNQITEGEVTKEDLKRQILEIALNKKHLTYLETKWLFQLKVLEQPKKYYNDNILGKFFTSDFDF